MSDQELLVTSLQSIVARQRDELRKITQLREDKALLTRDVAALRSDLAASQAEVARLREALQWIAENRGRSTWDREGHQEATERARAAMQGEGT